MKLDGFEIDALAEIINIGVGRAASALSQMTGSPISLEAPKIHASGTPEFDEIAGRLDLECAIQQGFGGDLAGRCLLAFSKDNAFELARVVGGVDAHDTEMDEELSGVLEEIGNIVLNAVLGSISNVLVCQVSYNLPELCTKREFSSIVSKCADDAQCESSISVIADAKITVANKDLSGSLLVLFETGDIKVLLSRLTSSTA
jgi:chemotaxis protein CheC